MSPARVLLVAGPSGGGKSVFISQVKANALDPAIAALLPPGCADWPVVEANDVMKDGRTAVPAPASDGLILHYDITFIHRFALTDYTHDPFCAALLSAPPADVVYVKPDAQRLIDQFVERRDRHRGAKSASHVLWADWVRLPLKRARLRRRGLPTREAHELYAEPASWTAATRAGNLT